jgi:hypothetical protein
MTLRITIQKAKPPWPKFRVVCRIVWHSRSAELPVRVPLMVAVTTGVYSSSDAASKLSNAESASSGTSQLRRIV